MRSTLQSKREHRKRGEETNVSRLEPVEKSVRGDARSEKTRGEKGIASIPSVLD